MEIGQFIGRLAAEPGSAGLWRSRPSRRHLRRQVQARDQGRQAAARTSVSALSGLLLPENLIRVGALDTSTPPGEHPVVQRVLVHGDGRTLLQ